MTTPRKKGSPWTKEDKVRAAGVYAVTGSSIKTEEQTGITASTIRSWIAHQDKDFLQYLEEAGKLWDKKIVPRMRDCMNVALDNIVAKIGEADARSSATIYGILFDKCQVAQNKPTSISATQKDLEAKLKARQETIKAAAETPKATGKLLQLAPKSA